MTRIPVLHSAKLPYDVLYTRLDGQLAVIEVELIEPIFYFNLVPESIERMVQAVGERLHD